MQKVARVRTYFAPGAVGAGTPRLHFLFMVINYFVKLIGYLIVSIIFFVLNLVGKIAQILH